MRLLMPIAFATAVAAMAANPAAGGVYFSMEFYVRRSPSPLPEYTIVHPPGYDGSGGVLEVRICVDPGAPSRPLVGPLLAALRMWNQLKATTGNCGGAQTCVVIEDTSFPAGTTDAMSTLLHEVGHCAMGLGHPNLKEEPSLSRNRHTPASVMSTTTVAAVKSRATATR